MNKDKDKTKEKRGHGSPYDRGLADRYYGRPEGPHHYPNGTYNTPRIEAEEMTEAERAEYYAGYADGGAEG